MSRAPVQWDAEMDAALIKLRGGHVGLQRCGELIGVHRSVVKRRLRHLGLPSFGPGGPQPNSGRKKAA